MLLPACGRNTLTMAAAGGGAGGGVGRHRGELSGKHSLCLGRSNAFVDNVYNELDKLCAWRRASAETGHDIVGWSARHEPNIDKHTTTCRCIALPLLQSQTVRNVHARAERPHSVRKRLHERGCSCWGITTKMLSEARLRAGGCWIHDKKCACWAPTTTCKDMASALSHVHTDGTITAHQHRGLWASAHSAQHRRRCTGQHWPLRNTTLRS